MHKNAGVNSDYVGVETCHSVPPILLDIVLEFYTHLAVIIYGSKSVINLT